MASGSYQDGGGAISDINVTPLVDVVLVLLVIFMVTAPLIAAQGIVVDSPQASTGVSVQSTLNLAITKDGELLVSSDKGETRFAADNRRGATAILKAFHAEHPESKAVIAGDKNISHGAVMEVIDMVRAAGIEKFALRTKLRTPKRGDDDSDSTP
jgi:biopolymer transport protein ExbD